MFESVPILKRWKVIIGIIGLAFVVSIMYAKQVWDLRSKVKELETKTKLVEDADMEIVNRQVRLKELGAEVEGLQSVRVQIHSHGELMEYIEQLTDSLGLQLIQMPRQSLSNLEPYQLANVNFSVSGNFHAIVQFIYRLEAVDRVGSVSQAVLALRALRKDVGPTEILVADIRITRLVSLESTSFHNENILADTTL